MNNIIDYQNNRLLKILLIMGFFNFVIIGLISLIVGPVKGYEISIYDTYPTIFWVIICVTFSIGFISLFLSTMSKAKSNLYILSVVVLVLINIFIILLPLLRNYFISDFSDEIYHLGMARDILNGRIGYLDFYPLSHIFMVIISSFSDLELRTVTKIVPSFYFLAYIFGIYFLLGSLKLSFHRKIWVIAFSFVPLYTFYNYVFFPQQLALYLVPIILAIYYKTYNSPQIYLSYILVLTILLISLPFLHPLASLFVLIILLTFEILRHCYCYRNCRNKRVNCQNNRIENNLLKPQILAQIVLSIVFLTWFSYYSIFSNSIKNASDAFFLESSEHAALIEISEKLNKANFSFFDTLYLAFKSNGQEIIFTLLSIILIAYIIFTFFIRREKIPFKFFYFPLLYIIFTTYFISTLIIPFMRTGYQIRIYCWALIFTIIICGLAFGEIYSRIKITKVKFTIISLVVILLIISTSIGVHNLYLSPIIKKPNIQVSEKAWNGSNWYYLHKNSDPTVFIDQLPERAPSYLFGHSSEKLRYIGQYILAPKWFGYDNQRTIFSALNNIDSYLLISDRNYATYTILWPDIGLIRSKDFVTIKTDPTANLVYYNGGLSVWKVQGNN